MDNTGLIHLEVLTCSKKDNEVRKALKKAAKEINEKLSKKTGSIAKVNVSTNVGIPGAKINLIVTIDDSKERSKKILWTNKGGSSEEDALTKARKSINKKFENHKGELADSYIEYTSPPMPQKVYVTILLAINGKVSKKTGNLTTQERRARINEIVNLAGGDPKTINISKIADCFNVNRDIIYNDLKKLDLKR